MTSSPARYDIEIRPGATYRKKFVWKSDGVAVPLDDYSARMQIRKLSDDEVMLEIESGVAPVNPRIELGPEDGEILIYIGATQTPSVIEQGVYDLELFKTTDEDEVVPLLAGEVFRTREITRDDA